MAAACAHRGWTWTVIGRASGLVRGHMVLDVGLSRFGILWGELCVPTPDAKTQSIPTDRCRATSETPSRRRAMDRRFMPTPTLCSTPNGKKPSVLLVEEKVSVYYGCDALRTVIL